MEPHTVGNVPNNCLSQVSRLYNADRTQFFKRQLVVDSAHGNLPYSGKFLAGGVQWKLHGESGLLTSTNRYVAQVSIDASLDELDRATTFNFAKEIVLKRLRVVRVLLDECIVEVQNARKRFVEYLENAFEETEDLFQLERILMMENLDSTRLVAAVEENSFLSVRAKQFICEYIELETKIEARSNVFNKVETIFEGTQNFVDMLKKSVRKGISNHKAKVLEMLPDFLESNFENVWQDKYTTKPFVTASNKSSSFEDFGRRVLPIKKSFRKNQTPNSMDLNTGLKLFKDSNNSTYMEENLGWCYNIYRKRFDFQLMDINTTHSQSSRIQQIVQQTLQITGHSPFSEWQNEAKLNDIPRILAGLSAVWSLQFGQDMQPHCIQILCVLRLLSAGREEKGVRNHMIEVVSGQGKSLILALVASVLALCGHSVQIMCYNKYLANRDERDFEQFYECFSVRSKISYQTFEDCIGLPEGMQATGQNEPKPILLIDEVDVFFDDKLYGETFNLKMFVLENFSLILGVSGTLTTLNNYEKSVVKDDCNITELSVMPSFTGESNLIFHETSDFSCLNSITSWMNAIFNRINTIVNASRSVVVFFDTDLTIDAFKRQFLGQLNRLNVLTNNTNPDDMKRFVDKAGVSRTITLATRKMGRGVDYKSSVAVEKNGGVHVIQSFFSEDVKEEIQIKGRTARKGNQGSYELIVCIEHLRGQKLVESDESCLMVSYRPLNESRLREMTLKNAARDGKFRNANEGNDSTVNFNKDKIKK